MAGKEQYDWAPDEQLVKEIIQAGGIGQWSRAKGVSDTGTRHHLRKKGLVDRVQDGLKKRLADRALPVDDPERVKADQQAAELKALRRENNEYAKALAKQEQLFERFVEASRIPVKAPKYRVKPQGRKPARSVILPVFDMQYGQHVQPADTPGGTGSYSTRVFDRRLARWVEGVTGSIRDYADSHRLDELVFALGGDFVEGDEIFPGQAWQLEIDPPRQVWELTVKVTDALRTVIRFAKEDIGIPKVGAYGVPGNHGKVGGKKSGARPTTYNWDWLFLMLLRDRLRGEPIDQFEIEPGGSVLFSAADHIFLMIHGDEIRGWGGLPFYGLTKFDGRAMRLHRTLYDYLLMGHHHQPAIIPNGSGEHIVSGDWVGATNLSRVMTAASRPQQRVLFVARKWGLAETSNIYFTPADELTATTVHEMAA